MTECNHPEEQQLAYGNETAEAAEYRQAIIQFVCKQCETGLWSWKGSDDAHEIDDFNAGVGCDHPPNQQSIIGSDSEAVVMYCSECTVPHMMRVQ